MYPLVETIKVQNGIIVNIDLHQVRMQNSYLAFFRAFCPYDLKRILTVPEEFSRGQVKLRFLYSREDYTFQFSNYRAKNINTLRLVFDDDIDYSLKYTDRSMIDQLLKNKGDADDILIVKNSMVTDTSIANIIFFDGKNWVTPANPLLQGVCRSHLLKKGTIYKRDIFWKDIFKFESFSWINALNCDFSKRILPISNIIYK